MATPLVPVTRLLAAVLTFCCFSGQQVFGQSIRAGETTVPGNRPMSQSDQPKAELALDLVSSIILPSDFRVDGAAIASDGLITVVWSRFVPGVRVIREERTHSVCLSALRPVGAAFVSGHTFEVVDAATKRVFRTGETECVVIGEIVGMSQIVAAARSNGTWATSGTDSSGRSGLFVLTRMRDGFLAHQTVGADSTDGDPGAVSFSMLRASEAGFLLSSTRFPFRWVEMSPEGRVLHAGQALGGRRTHRVAGCATEVTGLAQVTSDWTGLAIVALDKGYMQTLADPRSDSRVLLTFDSHAELCRATQVEVSLGLLSSRPAQRELLAARRTDLLEIVTYRWHWQ